MNRFYCVFDNDERNCSLPAAIDITKPGNSSARTAQKDTESRRRQTVKQKDSVRASEDGERRRVEGLDAKQIPDRRELFERDTNTFALVGCEDLSTRRWSNECVTKAMSEQFIY